VEVTGAVKAVQELMGELMLQLHPDKTFIGRVLVMMMMPWRWLGLTIPSSKAISGLILEFVTILG
jgi:hypothetical protein